MRETAAAPGSRLSGLTFAPVRFAQSPCLRFCLCLRFVPPGATFARRLADRSRLRSSPSPAEPTAGRFTGEQCCVQPAPSAPSASPGVRSTHGRPSALFALPGQIERVPAQAPQSLRFAPAISRRPCGRRPPTDCSRSAHSAASSSLPAPPSAPSARAEPGQVRTPHGLPGCLVPYLPPASSQRQVARPTRSPVPGRAGSLAGDGTQPCHPGPD